MSNPTCQCGEPVGDSIGDAYGLCQECWEGYCSREWWHVVNQIAEVIADE